MLAALVLGIIQGLTEFLPISSSAHLILVPWIFGWAPNGIEFDVALHVGTAVAVLGYFWQDWVAVARAVVQGLIERKPFGNSQRLLGWYLIAGTVPAVLSGLLLEGCIEEHLRSALIPAFTLVIFGVLLYHADKKGRQVRALLEISWADSLWVGAAQALALIPGVSRSGITITAALWRDIERASAARFSFLLATPVIVGAGVMEGVRFYQLVGLPASAGARAVAVSWEVLTVGVLASAATGVLCIRYFLRYIQTNNLTPFVVYRFALAAVVAYFHFRRAL